jgi:hypothetical protein
MPAACTRQSRARQRRWRRPTGSEHRGEPFEDRRSPRSSSSRPAAAADPTGQVRKRAGPIAKTRCRRSTGVRPGDERPPHRNGESSVRPARETSAR